MKSKCIFGSIVLKTLQAFFAWFVQSKAKKGHLEVERKFPINEQEAESLPMKLRELGFKPDGSLHMADTFIPPREAGEMMRVRDERSSGGVKTVFTLKSWVDTADGGRERKESETVVGPLLRTIVVMLARKASSQELLTFSKDRALFSGKSDGKDVVVSVDRVSGLGQFSGNYCEVECLVPVGDNPSSAQSCIYDLVEKIFGSSKPDEKRSYLDMLKISKQLV